MRCDSRTHQIITEKPGQEAGFISRVPRKRVLHCTDHAAAPSHMDRHVITKPKKPTQQMGQHMNPPHNDRPAFERLPPVKASACCPNKMVRTSSRAKHGWRLARSVQESTDEEATGAMVDKTWRSRPTRNYATRGASLERLAREMWMCLSLHV